VTFQSNLSQIYVNELLEKYLKSFPSEEVIVDRCRKLLWTEVNSFFRYSLPGHFTASAWILSPERSSILLVDHPKFGCPLQPGGHADGDSNLLNVALREVREETGIEALILSKDPFDIDIHFIPHRKEEPAHYHYDVRFLCEGPSIDTHLVSPEGLKLTWHSAEEIAQGSCGADLARMQKKAYAFLQKL
jgi:8-oxo-dGTP pyrophosphatase MutT (NUDIX family)